MRRIAWAVVLASTVAGCARFSRVSATRSYGEVYYDAMAGARTQLEWFDAEASAGPRLWRGRRYAVVGGEVGATAGAMRLFFGGEVESGSEETTCNWYGGVEVEF